MTTEEILTHLDIKIGILNDKQGTSAKFGNYGQALIYQAQSSVLSDLIIEIKREKK